MALHFICSSCKLEAAIHLVLQCCRQHFRDNAYCSESKLTELSIDLLQCRRFNKQHLPVQPVLQLL